MSVRIDYVTIDCADGPRLAEFWSKALGYEIVKNKPGWIVLADPSGAGPNIGLQTVPEGKVVKNRVHVDLLTSAETWRVEVARLESLGARSVRYIDEQADEAHMFMQDPEGNEFCCFWKRPTN